MAKTTNTNKSLPQARWTTPSLSSPSVTSSTRVAPATLPTLTLSSGSPPPATAPIERCPECGSVYKMEYVGPQDDGHGHDHGHGEHDIHHSSDGAHNYEGEPVTMADFIKPEYR